jgi:hypothetical protein
LTAGHEDNISQRLGFRTLPKLMGIPQGNPRHTAGGIVPGVGQVRENGSLDPIRSGIQHPEVGRFPVSGTEAEFSCSARDRNYATRSSNIRDITPWSGTIKSVDSWEERRAPFSFGAPSHRQAV